MKIRRFFKTKKLFSTIFLFTIVIASLISKKAYGATAYIDPNGDGTTGGWSTTGTSYYTEIDEAIRQPTTPTTSDNIFHLNNDTNNIFFRMSTISSVSVVSQIQVWIYHNDGSNGQFHAQLYDDDETTTRSLEASFTSSSTDAWHSVTFSGLSLTQSQLDSLSISFRNDRPGGGRPVDNYIYAMYAEVTYSGLISISLNTDGVVDFGGMGLDSTKDTTSSGIDDVEVISVDAGPANLDVRSSTFSDGTNTWSLGTNNGVNQVLWESSNDGSNWTTFSVADTLYTLATNVSQGNTSNLYLRLTTPTSTSSYAQYGSTITIVATAP